MTSGSVDKIRLKSNDLNEIVEHYRTCPVVPFLTLCNAFLTLNLWLNPKL